MTPSIHVVDLYHGDDPVDFHCLASSGVVGVILKATQGLGGVDPKFLEYRERALSVFEVGCVHSYHFLDDSPAGAQVAHYLSVTSGMPGRWLDYERNPSDASNSCSLQTALMACRALFARQGCWPGMYGSDQDLLGAALDAGHFGASPIWLARYGGPAPSHKCDLWQFADGESVTVCGRGFDVSSYRGGDGEACKAWMKRLAGIAC